MFVMVATVPTVYGIETIIVFNKLIYNVRPVATALTVYGMRRRECDSRGVK